MSRNYTSEDVGYVYIAKNESFPHLIKIGFTYRRPYERVKELSKATGIPFQFDLLYVLAVSDPRSAEQAIHKKFDKDRCCKEFFSTPSIEVIEFCKQYNFEYSGSVFFGDMITKVGEYEFIDRIMMEKEAA